MRIKYKLTEQELEELKEATKPVRALALQLGRPESIAQKTFRVWSKVSVRVGCRASSISTDSAGDPHDFIGEPLNA